MTDLYLLEPIVRVVPPRLAEAVLVEKVLELRLSETEDESLKFFLKACINYLRSPKIFDTFTDIDERKAWRKSLDYDLALREKVESNRLRGSLVRRVLDLFRKYVLPIDNRFERLEKKCSELESIYFKQNGKFITLYDSASNKEELCDKVTQFVCDSAIEVSEYVKTMSQIAA